MRLALAGFGSFVSARVFLRPPRRDAMMMLGRIPLAYGLSD